MPSASDRKKKAVRIASVVKSISNRTSTSSPSTDGAFPSTSPSTSISNDTINGSSSTKSITSTPSPFPSAWASIKPPLSAWLLDAIASIGFTKMTPVQASTIPLFLGNKDVVVEAVTGSGKTLTFLIPVIERLLRDPDGGAGDDGEEDGERKSKKRKTMKNADMRRKRGQVGAVIILPTRELAVQIYNVLLDLLAFHGPSAAVLPGAVNLDSSITNEGDDWPEEDEGKLKRAERMEEEDMNDISESIPALPKFHSTGPRIHPMLLVGGSGLTPAQDLKMFLAQNPNVLIGTPGRLNDLLSSQFVHCTADSFEVLVLDEADRLLDLGFKETLTKIISRLPKQRRTGLFSASVSDAVVGSLVRTGLRNPVKVVVNVRGQEEKRTPASLQNTYILCPPSHRLFYIHHLLSPSSPYRLLSPLLPTTSPVPQKTIIYFSSCAGVDYFSSIFHCIIPPSAGYQIFPLHGKQSPNVRNRNFSAFTSNSAGKRSILLTTDLAARGLDIPSVDLVLQFDPPTDPKVFLHRCGRAGRAGRRGLAILFLGPGREAAYIDFLAVRKTPVEPLPLPPSFTMATTTTSSSSHDTPNPSDPITNETTAITTTIRNYLRTDRLLHEKSLRAFVSHIRSYTNHTTTSIFRLSDINWVSLANSFALLTFPSMPELRQLKLKPDLGLQPLDLEAFAYKDPTKEKKRLEELKKRPEMLEERRRQRDRRMEVKKRNSAWSGKRKDKEEREVRKERKRKRREAGEEQRVIEGEAGEEGKGKKEEWRELVEEVKRLKREETKKKNCGGGGREKDGEEVEWEGLD